MAGSFDEGLTANPRSLPQDAVAQAEDPTKQPTKYSEQSCSLHATQAEKCFTHKLIRIPVEIV